MDKCLKRLKLEKFQNDLHAYFNNFYDSKFFNYFRDIPLPLFANIKINITKKKLLVTSKIERAPLIQHFHNSVSEICVLRRIFPPSIDV